MAKKSTKKAPAKEQTTRLVTGKVRAAYVHLLKPDDFGDEPKYSVTAIIPKSDKKTIAKIKGAIKAATEQGFSDGGKLVGKNPKKIKSPLKDGEEDNDITKNPEFEDSYVVSFKTNKKPTVLSRSKRVLDDEDDVYSGMYVAISGAAFPYATKGSAGISFILGGVMKLEDGERLGGAGFDLDADFEEFEEEDEDGFDEEDEDEIEDDEDEEEEDDEEEEENEDLERVEKLIKKVKKAGKAGKKFVKELLEEYDIEDEDDLEDIADELEEWLEDNE